ncbi:MAG: hypothetical protein ACUVYA_13695, partial [Planctomycetota bacterium]
MVRPLDDILGSSRRDRPLHAAIVRGEFARASIRAIDAAEALRAPGVCCVLACEDLRGISTPVPLADGEVAYAGEPVAVVVAESRAAAADAAELVRVSCGAPDVAPSGERTAFSWMWASGDLEAELRKAEWKGTFRFALPAEVPRPLELASVAARFDPGAGTLAVLSSCGSPHALR